ncbi:MAG TPA: carboxypeptidase-like regulatory domain-containing protein, partial [Thermoanaerobaculia bacterium]|nr:carboxypeptidase-like regulatory domain-containing protein [Thermoanaerobaculia bacterium]
ISGNVRLTDLELGRAYLILLLDAAGNAWLEREVVAGDEPLPIVLDVGGSELRGEVVLGKDEVPLAATVELLRSSHSSMEHRRHVFQTDAKGRFSGRLSEPGKWSVFVRSEDPAVNFRDRSHDLVPPSDGGAIFLRIEVEDGRAAGRVVLTDGNAVAEATVTFAAHGGLGARTSTKSDDEGRFELRGLRLGEGVLHASKGECSSRPERVEVREDAEAEEITLTLLDRFEVTVQALSSDGPVPGATFFWREETPQATGISFRPLAADSHGKCRVSLPADATAFVIAPDTEMSGFAFDLVRVPVAPRTQTITLTRQGGRLIFPAFTSAVEEEGGTIAFPWLLHGSASAPLSFVQALARRHGMAGSGDTLVFPIAAPGDYSICLLTPTEIGFALAGPVLPTARCTTGVLRAGETLELRPPS